MSRALKISVAVLALSLLAVGAADAQRWGGHGHGGGFAGRAGFAAPREFGPMREASPRAPYARGGYPPEGAYPPRAYPVRPEVGGYPAYPPPAPRAGYRRGQFLPPGFAGAQALDPHRFRLRSPPPGYVWYGVGRDAYLVQRSTGLILDTAPGAW